MWGSVGQLWSHAWPQAVGEEGGRAVTAVGLRGLWGEGAGGETLSLGPMSATAPGDQWQPGWQGLGVEKEEEEHEIIREV